MGLSESPTGQLRRQGRRRRLPRRPRIRRCLLKGCEQRFHPGQVRQRYCSEDCRAAARKWSRWKAQQRYRATTTGKQRRNGQSQRYRERVRLRKASAPEAVGEPARVITNKFFRSLLRPARLLRAIRSSAAKPLTTLLLARVPAGAGTGPPTRAAVETGTHLSRRY
jgi:hypothetical protein